ncbi:uncharacterized protein LOC108625799 isoform X2 [Ceratina calcarata]|uniref:Uncharacterized protein LOC108625799 isoform X2 n=1 Tax=Ceratina calcarata TaxID=156304 RepID=A0AAJ7J150_9HYME|nr:uncharacterized protein LOC108625799 isoform X2 [Ceratina calcarata]
MLKIKRKIVNQAIDDLWISKRDGLKKEVKMKKEEKLDVETHCKIACCYKRSEIQEPKVVLKHNILSEIRLHINQKDWNAVKNLLLVLLHNSTDIEPLIWRYTFILTLYSNIDNLSNVVQFFKSCIGCQHSDTNLILKDILLSQFVNKES